MRFQAAMILPRPADSNQPAHWTPAYPVHGTLNPDHFHQLSHSVGALLQSRLLFCCELDFDDLLQAVCAQLAWHADKQSLDAVFALKMDGTRQDLFLVLED